MHSWIKQQQQQQQQKQIKNQSDIKNKSKANHQKQTNKNLDKIYFSYCSQLFWVQIQWEKYRYST